MFDVGAVVTLGMVVAAPTVDDIIAGMLVPLSAGWFALASFVLLSMLSTILLESVSAP